ncbi:hypothetical protein QFZ67_007111 [Streptomyces sp. V1I1]|nr:hypothetical protein [Streptomyces sp. V1I1]MDQ0945406.1 hypothetical protein [Streptomyces sp. V1I1]
MLRGPRRAESGAEDDPAWFASVAVLDTVGYEIVLRDTHPPRARGRHRDEYRRIAKGLTIWMAGRDNLGQPTRRLSDFYNTT